MKNPIKNLLFSLIAAGDLTGIDVRYKGDVLIDSVDRELDTPSPYDEMGIGEMNEWGFVRLKAVDEVLIPDIRAKLGDAWANRVPQWFGLYYKDLEKQGYELTDQQKLSLKINFEYAFFQGTDFSIARKIERTDVPGKRFKYKGVIPNAKFVRKIRLTDELSHLAIADELARMMEKIHYAETKEGVDFSPRKP